MNRAIFDGAGCDQCAADTFNDRANQTACFDCFNTESQCNSMSAARRLLTSERRLLTSGSTQAYAYRGCYEHSSVEMVLTDKTEERAVRFCSTDGTYVVGNHQKYRTCNSYCDGKLYSTFDEAVQICADVATELNANVRICSRSDLDGGQCCATGCGFDAYQTMLTWVLDPVDATTSLQDTWAQLLNPSSLSTTSTSSPDHTTCPGLCVAPAGYRVNAAGNNVEPCPINHYQDGDAANCTRCPWPSTYTSREGVIWCNGATWNKSPVMSKPMQPPGFT